ncbi:hypothetical protein O3P69_015351 [Scylla paramamosain]|uniref:Uncharacterized protein n=1 Tax=Scylla paramamosain TaxID=85552 RepID=A0AAW0T7F5_SCYPA
MSDRTGDALIESTGDRTPKPARIQDPPLPSCFSSPLPLSGLRFGAGTQAPYRSRREGRAPPSAPPSGFVGAAVLRVLSSHTRNPPLDDDPQRYSGSCSSGVVS